MVCETLHQSSGFDPPLQTMGLAIHASVLPYLFSDLALIEWTSCMVRFYRELTKPAGHRINIYSPGEYISLAIISESQRFRTLTVAVGAAIPVTGC